MEEIGELRGKKSLFHDRVVFIQKTREALKRPPQSTRAFDFRLNFQVLLPLLSHIKSNQIKSKNFNLGG